MRLAPIALTAALIAGPALSADYYPPANPKSPYSRRMAAATGPFSVLGRSRSEDHYR